MSDADIYAWVILPVIIFLARICDVTLGTIRIILVSRGRRNIAPVLGFFEVLIWIVMIGQLVQHLHSVTSYIGYAAGFAAGNFVGMWIEDRLAMGNVIMRIILPQGGAEVRHRLHEAGFGVTSFTGEGATGPVMMVFSIVPRKKLRQAHQIIDAVTPGAFISVEDVRSTEEGIFPNQSGRFEDIFLRRKAK